MATLAKDILGHIKDISEGWKRICGWNGPDPSGPKQTRRDRAHNWDGWKPTMDIDAAIDSRSCNFARAPFDHLRHAPSS